MVELGPRERTWPTTAALAVLGVLPTIGRFANGLVFDDRFVIGEGDFIFDRANLWRLWELRTMAASRLDAAIGSPPLDTYRPLSISTFFWDAALSGRSPIAYHATNLVLHAAVIVALHRLLLGLAREAPGAVATLVTLAFAASPWLTEAHVWIDGRSDPLAALFVLLATLAQMRAYESGTRGWGAATLAAVALLMALLSKEVAILAAPFVATVPLVTEPSRRSRVTRALPLAVACAIYAALRAHALHGARLGDPHATLALLASNTGVLWVDALAHLLAPLPYHLANLSDDYGAIPVELRVGTTLAAGAALAGIVIAMTRKRMAWARWGTLWFAGTLIAPVAITGSSWPGFGRFLYVPAIGLAVVVSELLLPLEASTYRRPAAAIAAMFVAASAFATVRATTIFRDDVTYFGDAVHAHPEQAWTYGFLGLALAGAGRCEAALPALETATVGAPDDARFRVHFGQCLLATDRVTQARAVALAGEARFRGTNLEAGFLLLHASTLGPPQAALAHELLTRCLALAPARDDCRSALRVVDGP